MWGWEQKIFFSYFKWDLDCSYLLSELIIVLFSIFTANKSTVFFYKKKVLKKKVNLHVSSLKSYRSLPHLKLLPNIEEIEEKRVFLSNSNSFIVMDAVVLWQGSFFFFKACSLLLMDILCA